MAVTIVTLRARLVTAEADLVKINAAIDSSLDNVEVESYGMNTGVTSQNTKRRSPEELYKIKERIEAEIKRLHSQIDGNGVFHLRMRRN